MYWINRDLQKYILEYLATSPEKAVSINSITEFKIFHRDNSAFHLINELHDFADKIQIPKIQNFTETELPATSSIQNQSNPFWIYSQGTTRNSTLGKWSNIVRKNCYYLYGHNLISEPVSRPSQGTCTCITSQGIDFLAEDGGLSAILGVVTVKLHSETIKSLLAAKIDASSDLSPDEKERYKSSLSTIKDAALTKITELAIESIPVAALLGLFNPAVSS